VFTPASKSDPAAGANLFLGLSPLYGSRPSPRRGQPSGF
jgi:hypothetical protein